MTYPIDDHIPTEGTLGRDDRLLTENVDDYDAFQLAVLASLVTWRLRGVGEMIATEVHYERVVRFQLSHTFDGQRAAFPEDPFTNAMAKLLAASLEGATAAVNVELGEAELAVLVPFLDDILRVYGF